MDRDLRLDACRGVALWFIFLDHVPNNVGSWFTLRNYGFSDATEVFMFVSGATCALAYGRAWREEGWTSVVCRTLLRAWDIYLAFLLLIIGCVVIVYVVGDNRFADDTNTRILLENPGATLAHAIVLQYRPVNTDVFPTFIIYHAMFAPLLWLLTRAPNIALASSLLLYSLVHIVPFNLPAWPYNEWYFNPFAWQLLVVFGAWWVMGGGDKLWPWLATRTALVLAVLFLLISFIVALSWNIPALDVLIPQALADFIYPIDKQDLSALRVVHFLALLLLAVRVVPYGWRALMTPVKLGAIRCGENSLEIYCLSVLLALGAHIGLVKISGGIAMQIVMSLGGVLIMVAAGTLLTWIKIKSGRQPGLF